MVLPRPRRVRADPAGAAAPRLAAAAHRGLGGPGAPRGRWRLAGRRGGAAAPETHAVVREPSAVQPRLDAVPRSSGSSARARCSRSKAAGATCSWTPSPSGRSSCPPTAGRPAASLRCSLRSGSQELRASGAGLPGIHPPEGRTRVNNRAGLPDPGARSAAAGRSTRATSGSCRPSRARRARRDPRASAHDAARRGTPNADRTGSAGALKRPLRSLRFGTERAGGA